MSTYPEIDPKDIKAGDTIERHWLGTVMAMPVARVRGTVAFSPEDYGMSITGRGGRKFFLVDRPAPPIELPETPTLGWLTYGGGEESAFGKFRSGDVAEASHAIHSDAPIAIELGSSGRQVNAQFRVTAFTPATAVPTEALDELRANDPMTSSAAGAVERFLAAVTKANS